MARRLTAIAFLLVCVLTLPAVAGQRIELVDGTVIQGEVLSFDGKTYTIRGDSIGTMKVDKSKVRSIRADGAPAGAPSGNTDLQDIRNRVMANPQAMATIMGLQDDPEVKEVLQDEEILNAVNRGDIQWLMSNPKIQKLLQNPKVQEVGRSLK